MIVGWQTGRGGPRLLYADATDGDGPSTPYPLVVETVGPDGARRLPPMYACGLTALTGGGCRSSGR